MIPLWGLWAIVTSMAGFGIACYKGVPWLLDLPKVEAERTEMVPCHDLRRFTH